MINRAGTGQAQGKLQFSRRRLLEICSAAGLQHTLLPGALLALADVARAQDAPPRAQEAADALPPISAAMIDQAAAIAGVHIDDAQKEMMLAGLTAQRDDLEAIRKLPPITVETLQAAAVVAGITLTPDQCSMMLEGVRGNRDGLEAIRAMHLPNSVAPAFVFDPVPAGTVLETVRRPPVLSAAPQARFAEQGSAEANTEALAFLTVRELAELVKTRRVSSTTLTRMYLARLKRFDARLHFVITLTEERALRQAAAADAEIAAGRYRGPLHGIPWGAKDLLAVAGYPTTWGAAGFEDQHFAGDAEVVKRLDAAGAVLIAKLALGALAQGDLWGYPAGTGKPGARCRNPWNPRQGSSGSSAGSASAVAAGCVGFAIGTETLGSISSPSTRCGATGLRPSFGLVPRTGAMALSWTMDKIGPIARSVEDCALVLAAIYGPDGHDRSVQAAAFNWDANADWRQLRVGYLEHAFTAPTLPEMKAPTAGGDAELESDRKRVERARAQAARAAYDLQYANAALRVLRETMHVQLTPVALPDLPFAAMVPPLEAEGAAAFDELTRSGRDKLLAGQQPYDWPNNFRVARFYPAVDYIQAMRARMLAIDAMDALFKTVDVIVTPSQGLQLQATNLTGQPAVIVPNGLRGDDAPPSLNDTDGAVDNVGGPGTPVSLTFLGGLYRDAKLAAFARAYEGATGFARLHPKLS